MRVALVTGGFDPLHFGHIQLLNGAARWGDIVVVGLNSDDWLKRKKGAYFMSHGERSTIVRHLHMVHSTLSFNDRDDTACNAIALALERWPDYSIRFCNGGDRIASNTPEFETYKDHPRVQFRWGVGGDKIRSSSDLLARWEHRHANK